MGEVWMAEQVTPRRQVAVKIIKAGMDTARVVARFEAERQALALMDHPAIATVFNGGATAEGRPYFAMEDIAGEPVTATAIVSGFTPTGSTVRTGLRGRAARPPEGHCSPRPGAVERPGHGQRMGVASPKIIDFGVAKATTQHLAERTLFTELGVLIGTPEYMSPEQADLSGLDSIRGPTSTPLACSSTSC